MPLIDMPLEELKTYTGLNPKPADFDAYWETALAEMRAVDPDPEMIPAGPGFKNVECFDLYFTGTKGCRIHAKMLKPKQIPDKAPAVLFFHGYGGHSEDWMSHAVYAEEGFVVADLDCRGQGGYSEDKNPVSGTTIDGHIIRGLQDPDPHNLFYRDQFLDTAMLARVIMELDYVDETRVGCSGGSQGGALTIACASLVPEIKAAAPCVPFLCDYRRVWEMDLDKDAYKELRYFFRMFDPRHEREDEIFTKLGYIDLQYLAPRIKANVIMFTGLMDTVCPPSTQFAAYNKMQCEKKVVIYPDFGHEELPDSASMIFELMQNM